MFRQTHAIIGYIYIPTHIPPAKEAAMFKKFKANLFSENGMRTVNLMFALIAFVGSRTLITGAFVIWIFYLYYSFKATKYKSMKIFYCALAVFAAAYIIISLYSFATSFLCLTGSRCPNL